ncbi:MAG: hypothetical protein GXP49_17305 [Deltaproteobacteria bacterium]|nr:hypothetical protein [Deltaproteobacteria bacterium]
MNEALSKHHFQVLVLGRGPGAAACAAILAKSGLRTGLAQSRRHAFGDMGKSMPARPLFAPQADGYPGLSRILYELGLQQEYAEALFEPDPIMQFIGPGFRIDLKHSRAATIDELEREIRGDSSKLYQRLLQAAQDTCTSLDTLLDATKPYPPLGFFEKLAVKKITRDTPWHKDRTRPLENPLRLFKDDSVLRAISLSVPAFSGAMNADCSFEAGTLARSLGWLSRGVYDLDGKEKKLTSMFTAKLKSKGGTILHGKVNRIEMSRARPAIARCDNGVEINFDILVLADHPAYLQRVLTSTSANRRLSKILEGCSAGTWLGGTKMTVALECVPEPLAQRAFIINDPSVPLCGGNMILVDIKRGQRKAGYEKHGKKTKDDVAELNAFAIFSKQNTPESPASLEQIVRERLKLLFPFLDEHLKSSQVIEPGDYASPAHLEALSPMQTIPFKPVIPIKGPFNNTFFLHPWTIPGLGLESEMLLALRIAQIVLKKLGKSPKR